MTAAPITARRKTVYVCLGVPTPFDSVHTLVTSPILSPFALAIIRSVLAVYGFVFILYRLIYEGITYHSNGAFLSYFTTLSYIGLLAYFWAAGAQTLAFTRSGCRRYPLQGWPKFLQFLHMLLFSTVTTFPILVTTVYWSLLATSRTFATRYNSWVNITEHALNTVFAAFEIFFTNSGLLCGHQDAFGIPWIHLPFLIGILICYLAVAYITYGTQHFYVYLFLDPKEQHGFVAAYIIGIGVGEAIVFVTVRYLCLLRNHLVLRVTRLGLVRVRTKQRSGKLYHGLLDVEIQSLAEEWEEEQDPLSQLQLQELESNTACQ